MPRSLRPLTVRHGTETVRLLKGHRQALDDQGQQQDSTGDTEEIACRFLPEGLFALSDSRHGHVNDREHRGNGQENQ